MKSLNRIATVIMEIGIDSTLPQLYSGYEAMINFVKREGVAKGVKLIELRMWYTREQLKQGMFAFDHMAGAGLPAYKFTKLTTREEREKLRHRILGLGLVKPTTSWNTASASGVESHLTHVVTHDPKGVQDTSIPGS
jgi:hypothetical protein